MRTTLSSENDVDRLAGKVGQRRDVWDSTVKGLHLRITKPTPKLVVKRWRFLYRNGDGKRRVWTWGEWPAMPLEEAQEKARQARRAVQEGRDPKAEALAELAAAEAERERAKGHTLVALAAAHCRSQRRQGVERKTVREEIRQFKVDVLPVVGESKAAADLTPEDVDAVIARIVGRGAKTMADRVRATLFAIYKWGRADRVWKHILATNPVESVARALPKEKRQGRDRVLTDDELKRLWLAAEPGEDGKTDLKAGVLHPVIGAAFRLRILTGQRWTEIVKTRWSHVSTERMEIGGKERDVPVWIIPREHTKTRRNAHAVPLSPQAVAVLERLQPLTEDRGYIFPALRGHGHLGESVGRSFRAWTARAKVEDFIGKDLRRTMTTGLTRFGVGLEIRDAVTNHAQRGVDRVYNRYDFFPEKLAALERWGRHVEWLATGKRVLEFPSRQQA